MMTRAMSIGSRIDVKGEDWREGAREGVVGCFPTHSPPVTFPFIRGDK